MNNENTPQLPEQMLCRDCSNAQIYASKSQVSCYCKISHRELFDVAGSPRSYIVLSCTDKITKGAPQEPKLQ